MDAKMMKSTALWSAAERFGLGALFLMACLTPAIIHWQPVTGTVINATLLVCAIAMGAPAAALLGAVPSLMAAAGGTLPLPLIPLVPYIVASNAILVFVFAGLYRRSPLASLAAAAFLKFGFLSLVSAVAVGHLVPSAGLRVAAAMLSWPQLATALAGGLIALAALRSRGGRS